MKSVLLPDSAPSLTLSILPRHASKLNIGHRHMAWKSVVWAARSEMAAPARLGAVAVNGAISVAPPSVEAFERFRACREELAGLTIDCAKLQCIEY